MNINDENNGLLQFQVSFTTHHDQASTSSYLFICPGCHWLFCFFTLKKLKNILQRFGWGEKLAYWKREERVWWKLGFFWGVHLDIAVPASCIVDKALMPCSHSLLQTFTPAERPKKNKTNGGVRVAYTVTAVSLAWLQMGSVVACYPAIFPLAKKQQSLIQ